MVIKLISIGRLPVALLTVADMGSDGKPQIRLDPMILQLQLMMEKGLLPHFKQLIEEGAWGSLQSTVPPLSPPAWATFATGKNPGKHGIFGFTEPVEKEYSIRFVNARSRRADPFWKILSDRGKRVGVINVPMTYPPDKVNGFFIQMEFPLLLESNPFSKYH